MRPETVIIKAFADLTLQELYEILQARNAVFVVEQNCVYQDADGYDQQAIHLVLPVNGKLAAYCRVLLPNVKFSEWSIGRFLTLPQFRGKKLAHQLMTVALDFIARRGGGDCRISAQAYLQKFYEAHGFARVGDEYLEDGIPHIEMVRTV
jgi:ElaA protein